MRRIGALVSIGLLVVCVSQVRAAVVHITVDEPTDAAPSVTTDIVGAESTSDFEVATLTGFVLGSGLPVGTTSVLLTEPSSDPFNAPNSDLIILQIFQATTDGSTSQQVNLSFVSDSFQGFDRLVAANPNAVKVEETGSLQDITALLGLPVDTNGAATILQVRASSDLATPEIPEPGSLTLLAIGAASVAAYGAMKRRPPA
jgi:hypothetical protein